MTNAQFGVFEVSVRHNGQKRICHLFVVKTVEKSEFFLRDYFGCAIDDHSVLTEAINQYQNNTATEVANL